MTARTRSLGLVLLATVVVAVFLATVPTFRHFFDLGVYRGAVRYWLVDGGDLYQYRYRGTEYGFTYPPFAALVMSPLAITSWPVAIAAAVTLNAAAVIMLIRWYFVPILRARDWPVRTPCALLFLGFLVFEPSRDTFSFGQVNLLLLVLVCGDLRNRRHTGIGIGLAAAIKLTPVIFIGYLILARRYRAAATATVTAAAATFLALLAAPDASTTFWTDAVWDTGRIGELDYVSNQSLRGVVARLGVEPTWWLAGVALVVAYWCWWVRTRRPDDVAGFAVTGVLACLISPVTWVHHLVWLVPALFLLLGASLGDRRRLAVLGAAFALMSSSIVWLWWAHPHGWPAFPGSNTYVWLSLAILFALTRAGGSPRPAGAPMLSRAR